MKRVEQSGRDYGSSSLIDQFTDPATSLEERVKLARQLFPETRKTEVLGQTDKDSKGRPVRYFRLMTYEELRLLLSSGSVNGTDNPVIRESFDRQRDQIRDSLEQFLKSEGIFESFQEDFRALADDFNLENYRGFVQGQLPRRELFKLHVSAQGGGGSFIGATGLMSLSVGAPYQPPSEPNADRGRNYSGLPVVEMSIPSDQVYINPRSGILKEMEKEVNTIDLNPEWITDVYIGAQDFAERFIKDPQSAPYSVYEERRAAGQYPVDHLALRNVWDILQNWKLKESVQDLIPPQKLFDLGDNNPELDKPLLT